VINGYFKGVINPMALNLVDKFPYDAFVEHSGKDIFREIKNAYRKDKEKTQSPATFKEYLNHWHTSELYRYREINKNILSVKKLLYQNLEIGCKRNDLFENYQCLHRYKYTFEQNLAKVASTKFKMNYKVKYMEKLPVFGEDGKITERGRLIDLYYEMKDFQHIFEVVFEDDIIKFNFNTPLGKLIIYNIMIMDTDWMPLDVLNLKKNAYFLYKRFVLNKRSGKFKAGKIELKFDEIKEFLDIRWKNDRGVHSMVLTALKDMKENGLVDDFVWNKNINNRRVYELHYEDKKKEQKKEKDAAGEELKMIA
jgi:hypothetical protein